MPTFSAIGLVVSDMERSLSFYRALGFAVPDAVEHDV
jgi:catechol 2,3-dioxygenase-like lactoylglutathione lyase family enzyme